jgi:hypothetical protein
MKSLNFFFIFFNLMKYVSFEILWTFWNILKFLKYWNWNFLEKFSILILFSLKFYKSFEIYHEGVMTTYFRFVNKRAIYRLGIFSLAHVPVSYGILNPMVNWTRGRFTYDILTPGSIFLMVFWPRGQFFVIVLWTPSWYQMMLVFFGTFHVMTIK